MVFSPITVSNDLGLWHGLSVGFGNTSMLNEGGYNEARKA